MYSDYYLDKQVLSFFQHVAGPILVSQHALILVYYILFLVYLKKNNLKNNYSFSSNFRLRLILSSSEIIVSVLSIPSTD